MVLVLSTSYEEILLPSNFRYFFCCYGVLNRALKFNDLMCKHIFLSRLNSSFFQPSTLSIHACVDKLRICFRSLAMLYFYNGIFIAGMCLHLFKHNIVEIWRNKHIILKKPFPNIHTIQYKL